MKTTLGQTVKIRSTSLTQWWMMMMLMMMMVCTVATSVVTFTDNLDWQCGGYVHLSHLPAGSVRLQLTNKDNYSPNMDCEVTYHAHEYMRILLTFEYLDVLDNEPCPGDYLEVNGGNFKAQVTENVLVYQKFCGVQTPDGLVSSHSNLTLRFVSDEALNGRGFVLYLTAFHDGECKEPDEFVCDNNRCIDSNLYCDNVDNCGDGSDLCNLAIYVIVCTVLLSILLMVAALTLTAVLWYRWKRRLHWVNEEEAPSESHTNYIYTMAEGAHVVSMFLSQLMPARPPTMDWTSRHARLT